MQALLWRRAARPEAPDFEVGNTNKEFEPTVMQMFEMCNFKVQASALQVIENVEHMSPG